MRRGNYKFGKITQNKGHFAVQGHSRSPILVPIKSSYTVSYQDDRQVLRALNLKFMNLLQNFHLAVIKYLYRGRRAVPLQTFTTNRKLFIGL